MNIDVNTYRECDSIGQLDLHLFVDFPFMLRGMCFKGKDAGGAGSGIPLQSRRAREIKRDLKQLCNGAQLTQEEARVIVGLNRREYAAFLIEHHLVFDIPKGPKKSTEIIHNRKFC